MAKRDVDSVDPACPAPVPAEIQEAERWRELGMELRDRSPEIFAKVFELLVVTRVLAEGGEENIPESYFVT